MDEDNGGPEDEQVLAALKQVLGALGEREKRVLAERFGIKDDFNTIEALALAMNYKDARKKVKEIEKRALAKLRGGRGPENAA